MHLFCFIDQTSTFYDIPLFQKSSIFLSRNLMNFHHGCSIEQSVYVWSGQTLQLNRNHSFCLKNTLQFNTELHCEHMMTKQAERASM